MLTHDEARGIQDNAERSFLVFWLLIVLVSSLLGDSIILIATCRYKVLNFHKVIVPIIQYMAACDLLQSIFRVFPTTTAVLADRWVLGEVIGHIQANLLSIMAGYSMSLTCALTAVKLVHLKYPLVARTWSKNKGVIICLALLGLLLCAFVPMFVVEMFFGRDSFNFSYLIYECSYHNGQTEYPSWYKFYSSITFSLFQLLCYTMLVINSVLILLKAKKVRSRTGGGVRLQGTITVLLTVAVQFISYLPLCVAFVIFVITDVKYSGKMWRCVSYAVYLNTMANFYIYYFTNRSFRKFLKMRVAFLREFIQNKVYPGPY